MKLDELPLDVLLQELAHVSFSSLLALAASCTALRESALPLLYHSLEASSPSQLATLASLLRLAPSLGSHIRRLRLGPWDVLAAASSNAHAFSALNPLSLSVRTEDASAILSTCSNLVDLIIWDGLVGSPPLGSLPPSARLEHLALPFLWRGGVCVPSPHDFPQLEQLNQLDVVLSGLTGAGVRAISQFKELKVLRWYYRPMGVQEIGMLVRGLAEGLDDERQGIAPGRQIVLAANNGKLAQIEGWLAAQLPSEPPPPPSSFPNQETSETSSSRAHAEPDGEEMDAEAIFLASRRAAGSAGFAPGEAPRFTSTAPASASAPAPAPANLSLTNGTTTHAAGSTESTDPARLNAVQTQALPPPTEGPLAPRGEIAPPIMGGFSTESAEDVFARRVADWEERRSARVARGDGTDGMEGAARSRDERNGGSGGTQEQEQGQEESHRNDAWKATAARWLRDGQLVFDDRRWRKAVLGWEEEWLAALEEDDEEPSEIEPELEEQGQNQDKPESRRDRPSKAIRRARKRGLRAAEGAQEEEDGGAQRSASASGSMYPASTAPEDEGEEDTLLSRLADLG